MCRICCVLQNQYRSIFVNQLFFSLCYPTARHDGPNNKKIPCVRRIYTQPISKKQKRISRLWKRENTKASLCLRSSLADARRDALQGKFHTFYLHFVIKSIRRFRITFEQYNHFFCVCSRICNAECYEKPWEAHLNSQAVISGKMHDRLLFFPRYCHRSQVDDAGELWDAEKRLCVVLVCVHCKSVCSPLTRKKT